MTDFLTRFSCLLDVGTAANATRAFDIYTSLIAENAGDDPPAEPFLLSLSPEYGPARLWLRDPGSADQQLAITFVTLAALNATLYAVFAQSARRLLSSATAQRRFNLAGGTLLAGAGLWALLARRP